MRGYLVSTAVPRVLVHRLVELRFAGLLGCLRFVALQACKAADDLKANLEEEYVAVRTFIVEFCKCMDYIQHAKMLVTGCERQIP